MDKVTREVATKEVDSWLDSKKVNAQRRETYKDQIESLIDAVCDGSLSLQEDKSFIQTLKFPIGEQVKIESLEFKPRLKVATVHSHLQGVKSNDADGRVLAYVAALTSKPKDIIKALDTEDYSIGQSIAIFFL